MRAFDQKPDPQLPDSQIGLDQIDDRQASGSLRLPKDVVESEDAFG
jgi:hypothetical protein